MGYIYIIKNKINSKVYIGQTKYTIKQRFKEHIYECKRNYDKELYKDMNDYGIDNFYINIIEKCDNDLLNDREIYWISFYDSYKNGYNDTIGGSGNKRIANNIDEKIIKNILYDFNNGLSCMQIAIKYKLSVPFISRIIKQNIKSTDLSKPLKNKNITNTPIELYMYDKNFNFLKEFKSIKDAINWINKNTEYKINIINGYAYLKKSYLTGCIAYGHRWQRKKDLIYNNVVFRSIFDKQCFLDGQNFTIINGFAICKDAISDLVFKETFNYCEKCNKLISKYSKLCAECLNEERAKHSKIPEKEILLNLIKNYPFVKIGKMFDVSDNTIRKWCKKYDLPYKRKDIEKIKNK